MRVGKRRGCAAASLRAFLAIVVLIAMGALPATRAGAVQVRDRHVIHGDRGGAIEPRFIEVKQLRLSGQRVRITGRLCLSSCTMYLGAGDVCIDPDTTFGFHGPSRSGIPLKPEEFDHWSRKMASTYPAALAHWFMDTARYRIRGYYRVSGRELIRMGLSAC